MNIFSARTDILDRHSGGWCSWATMRVVPSWPVPLFGGPLLVLTTRAMNIFRRLNQIIKWALNILIRNTFHLNCFAANSWFYNGHIVLKSKQNDTVDRLPLGLTNKFLCLDHKVTLDLWCFSISNSRKILCTTTTDRTTES